MRASSGMRRGRSTRATVLCLMLLWSPSVLASDVRRADGAPTNEAFANIVAKFDSLGAVSVDTERWKTFTNEQGALAWDTSYALDAYLDMYEATRDWRYVQKFIILSGALAERTDERRGLADYKGRKRVGWGGCEVQQSRKTDRLAGPHGDDRVPAGQVLLARAVRTLSARNCGV